MNTTHSSILVAEVPGYAELQREMHDALRAQHPEWIEADGKSPTCDYYESRFAELLVSHRTHARANYDYLMNTARTYSERLSAGSISPNLTLATANSNIPVVMLRQETWSFPKWPRRFDSLVMKTKLTN
jgi:hypothetical protein